MLCALDSILVVRVNRRNNSTAQHSIMKRQLQKMVQTNRTVPFLASVRCACVPLHAPCALSWTVNLPVPVAEGVPVRFNSFTHRECSFCELRTCRQQRCHNAFVQYICQSCQPTIAQTHSNLPEDANAEECCIPSQENDP